MKILTQQHQHQQQPQAQTLVQQQQQAQYRQLPTTISEDAFELINFLLVGGPKWQFRIRQLNDNRVIISKISKAGPAEKCGLRVNDEILSVNNLLIVGNQPRSLLLHDYPTIEKVLNEGGDKDSPNKQGSQQKKSPNETEEPANNSELEAGKFAPTIVPSISIELSKLDFTYQLIRHSSLSNKLMLTVKRFLNPAYARASVAAASGANSSSPFGFRDEDADDQENQNQDHHQQHHQTTNSLKRQPMSMHYAYKCCECYCDNEGESSLLC